MQKNKRLLIVIIAAVVLVVGSLLAYQFSKGALFSKPAKASQPLGHHQLEEVKAKMVQILEEKDPRASFDYLRKATKDDTALARDCHPILHHVGHAAYKKYKDFDKTVSYQDGLCNSGYTHGTIEGHFMASKDIETTLKTTCSVQENKQTFQQWQCYHGVGHGVMYYTAKDLPRSLSMCESLPTDFARSSCANGAFMERFIIVSHSGTPASNTSSINTELCAQQAETYKPDCYFYAPTAYLERHTNDYSGVFDECTKAEKKYIGSCIYGVGGQVMKENVTRPEVARDACGKAPKAYAATCVQGAVSLLINHNASTAPVEPLCNTTFAQYKDACTKKIRSWNDYYES